MGGFALKLEIGKQDNHTSDGAHQHAFLHSNIVDSTFHHPPRVECLQILDILIYGRRVCCKAGDWILCTMIGYRIPERETYGMLLFIQLLHSCLLRRGKSATCYRYSYTLTYRILLSPHQPTKTGLSIVWKSKIS